MTAPPRSRDALRGRRVLVLSKRTSYRTFVEEAKDDRVKHLIARGDPTVVRLRRSHEAHEETLGEVAAALETLRADVTLQVGPRTKVAGAFDLVVTVGGDGTLLAASHQMGPNVPLLGVNSAPETSVGFFCAAKKGSVLETMRAAFEGKLKGTNLSRMRVDLNEVCLHKRVLNEALFCHACPAATTRYILRVVRGSGNDDDEGTEDVIEEEQRSSGLWIGPAAGSTAAQRSAGGKVLPLTSTKVQFVVREPYVRLGASIRLRMGQVDDGGAIILRSKMREAKVFLDGLHIVHDITIGDRLVMRRSDETLTVLGLTRRTP
jgi:NAD+ kinase